MKGLNKKGFTLIELLAVIVVLAIVALIGYSTVLPLLERTRKNAFATEANNVLDAAQTAMTANDFPTGVVTPIMIGTKYCYKLEDLKTAGLLTKRDLTNYSGQVVVTKSEDSTTHNVTYSYSLKMKNDKYAVNGVSTVSEDNVVDASTLTQALNCTVE